MFHFKAENTSDCCDVYVMYSKILCFIFACGLQILVANDMACELFAFDENELIGCQLTDLLSIKSRGIQSTSELHLRDNGEVIEVAGKVVSWVAKVGG